ncbi:MAG: NAD(P)-dependent alcohol dehydrogenase [SAR324 cluster bacterium]|nr:NAD(P)-dependent alcohol dehydrogenase [SAR324 cluster bacterium]
MKAIVYTQYGFHEELKLEDIEKPTPKEEEVLIKVYAVSINDWDWQLLQGIPFVNRVENGFREPKKIKILGSDIAGRIEAVGKNVKQFKVGDEVYGDLSGNWGGFAEYVCARETALALKPASMTFEEAAAIPQAAMLAVQGLLDKGKLQQGQKILINGAGGGVGTFGVQLAKLFGAEVTGVDSAEKLDMMRSMGFDHVIDYKKEDFTRNGQCYDLILDNKMNRSLSEYLRALSPNGIYVVAGGDTAKIFQVFLFPLISMFSKKRLCVVILKTNKDLAYMNELFEAGKVKPVIDDKSYTLSDVPEAFRYYGAGQHKGKVVITVAPHNQN